MLKTNLFGSHLQASKRTKIIQNELIFRKLRRLPRPIGGFLAIGLDIVSFILRFHAYFGVCHKIKKRLNL